VLLGAAILAASLPGAARAQGDCRGGLLFPPPAGSIIKDDNGFETSYGFTSVPTQGEYVMRVSPNAGTQRLRSVCLCWFHDQEEPGDDLISFDLNVYGVSGSGAPGALIASVPGLSADVNLTFSEEWQRVELTLPINVIVNGPFFVGPQWNPSVDRRFFLCADETGPGFEKAFSRTSGDWEMLGTVDDFPAYRALGIRAVVDAAPPQSTSCTRNAQTACLLDGRFEVKVSMKNFASPPATFPGIIQTYQGSSSETDQSVSFYSFTDGNVEVFVKMVDACGTSFDSFWLFAAGATNAETVITVRDTVADQVRTITNPSGQLFMPVANTAAFLTCDE